MVIKTRKKNMYFLLVRLLDSFTYRPMEKQLLPTAVAMVVQDKKQSDEKAAN